MATSIYYNGAVVSVPGAYSTIDASGLETIGLGSTGIVAVLGTAEGGRPVSDITEFRDIPRFNSSQKQRNAFRSGDLREVADMLFAPARDPDIQGGAAEVLCLKTNPATKSTAVLNRGGLPQVDLASRNYGAFTAGINLEISTGTGGIGKRITIRFEDISEGGDQIGGVALATLQYVGGYTTATASVNAAGDLTVNATRTGLGLATDIVTPAILARVQVVSTNVADNTQTATIYGLVGGVPTRETVNLNGTTPVLTVATFDAASVQGVSLSAAAVGTVTVRSQGAGADSFTMAAGILSRGVLLVDHGYVDKTTLTVVLDGAGIHNVLLFGRDGGGANLAETLPTNGTTPVVSTASTWGFIDVIAVGLVPVARTLTLSTRAARSLGTVQRTLQKASEFFNAKQRVIVSTTFGFIFTVRTGQLALAMNKLDGVTNVNIKSPATGSLTADLNALVEWINQNSTLVSATRRATATGVPDNILSPLFLGSQAGTTAGIEGVATFAQYQAALNLLKKGRVNSVVDLSGDPAVAAALDAHCAYMCGIGKSERDGFVGILNTALNDVPTKNEVKDAVIALNSRHIRAWGQAIERFDVSGERREFLPPFGAALLAGAQAGAPVGTSLTFKYLNTLALRQHSTWNPTDDAEEMVNAGLVFAQQIDGVGRRVVRNVTTHLSSNNLAFIEGSVNAAVNTAVFEFRSQMETAVGKRGFAGTLSAARGSALGILGLLVDNGIITSYRALQLELLGDVLDVSVELAPVIPINFVKITAHLVVLAQTA